MKVGRPSLRLAGMRAAALLLALPWTVSMSAHEVISDYSSAAGTNPAVAPGARGTEPDPHVTAEFASVRARIGAIGNEALSAGLRASLVAKIDAAEAAYVRSQACTAVNILGAFAHQTDALRRGNRVAVAERVRNLGWGLREAVLEALPDGVSCQGFERAGMIPEVATLVSDNRHFAARVRFGLPSLSTATGGDETWTQVSLPSISAEMGEPGTPAVPAWHALVAVPSGAAPLLGRIHVEVGDVLLTNLYPYQHQETDRPQNPDDPAPRRPFVKDEKLYATDAFYPAAPCVVTPLGKSRDLQLAQISCAAGQYNPVTDELRLFRSVGFDIGFEGGDGTFVTTRSLGPFEPPAGVPLKSALNGATAMAYVRTVATPVGPCEGEELLILTHGDFFHQAEQLAEWKRRKGIATNVFLVNESSAYDTGAEIDAFIDNRYDTCSVRPSYVLLFGDSEFVPPSRTDFDTVPAMGVDDGDPTTGTDLGYALYATSLFDILPDFAVGRISVDTAEQAQVVVDKVINYESTPPFIDRFSGDPFYTTASHASQFQCCRMHADGSPLEYDGRDQRNFIQTSELVRDRLVTFGYTVERVYTETIDRGGYCVDDNVPCTVQQPYNGVRTPDRYYLGTRLPADLQSGSGFHWTGSGIAIQDAINEGRFLVLHRDHGDWDSWTHPSFDRWAVQALTNGDLLPFVYSVNCSSGFFDAETDLGWTMHESMMETFLRTPRGGAVAGLGDNRVSPTWANSALARGFYDATWPRVLRDFGGDDSIRRLGDILNYGKTYLLTQVGVAQTTGREIGLFAALTELAIWHAFGDPTLEMWTRNPHRELMNADYTLHSDDDGMEVGYGVEGATITAMQMVQGIVRPVGRARVEGGVARIGYFREPVAGVPIALSASYENRVSIRLTPENQLPDLTVSLTGPDLASPGRDIGALIAVTVSNLGTAPALGTVDGQGNPRVQGGYMVDIVLSSDREVPDGFAPLPTPEGVAFQEDGLLLRGRVSRTPDVQPGVSVTLAAGAPIFSDVGGVIPSRTPPGSYYLCARIDPGAAVAESHEGNNLYCRSISIGWIDR